MQSGPTAEDILLIAIHNRDIDGVEKALNNGVSLTLKDSDGWTPLIHAMRFGDLAVVEKLIEAGADPRTEDNLGWTAYAHALDGGDRDIANYALNLYREKVE